MLPATLREVDKLGIVVLLAALLAAGCGRPKIDTSTDESMSRSVEDVRSSLPPERRVEFDQALAVVTMSSMSMDSLMGSSLDDVELSAERAVASAKEKLNGMTADEVFEEAERIEQEYRRREREAVTAEIRALRERRERAKEDALAISRFLVTGAQFYKESNYIGMTEPRIRLTMTNNTEHPISVAFFRAKLQTPGRAIPWLEEEFNYTIDGGLEPGETKTVTLAPNMFGEWGSTEAPNDAVLELRVVRLDGANGETVFDAEFSDVDEQRLRELLLQQTSSGGL